MTFTIVSVFPSKSSMFECSGANPRLSIDFRCSLMVHCAYVVCGLPKIETYEKTELLFHRLFLSLSCWEDLDPM